MSVNDRLNSVALLNDKRTNLEIARELAKPLGIKVYAKKEGWYWAVTSRLVAMFSDISAKDFLGNFTQTFWNRVYLAEDLSRVKARWDLLCTLPHEFTHSVDQFSKDKMFPTKYLASTPFRTKAEAEASVASLAMNMWRWPNDQRSYLVNGVVKNISSYGIKPADSDVLKSMLETYVDIIDQAINIGNIGLISKHAAATISWLEKNGYTVG